MASDDFCHEATFPAKRTTGEQFHSGAVARHQSVQSSKSKHSPEGENDSCILVFPVVFSSVLIVDIFLNVRPSWKQTFAKSQVYHFIQDRRPVLRTTGGLAKILKVAFDLCIGVPISCLLTVG